MSLRLRQAVAAACVRGSLDVTAFRRLARVCRGLHSTAASRPRADWPFQTRRELMFLLDTCTHAAILATPDISAGYASPQAERACHNAKEALDDFQDEMTYLEDIPIWQRPMP